MKKWAVIMILLLIAAVCGIGLLYVSMGVQVRFDRCVATEAPTQQAYFDQLLHQLSSGAFTGTVFDRKEPGLSDQYQFLTYTVLLTNHANIDAAAAEIRITPLPGDLLQLGETQELTVPAGDEVTLSATILTGIHTQSIREAVVTYYIWGLPFTETITIGS